MQTKARSETAAGESITITAKELQRLLKVEAAAIDALGLCVGGDKKKCWEAHVRLVTALGQYRDAIRSQKRMAEVAAIITEANL